MITLSSSMLGSILFLVLFGGVVLGALIERRLNNTHEELNKISIEIVREQGIREGIERVKRELRI